MGSINLAGTAYAESYIEGSWPSAFPPGPWTIGVWIRPAGNDPSPATGYLSAMLGDYSIRPSFNVRSDSSVVRVGTFDQSSATLSSFDVDDTGTWVYLAISSAGGTAPIRWTTVIDQGGGTWTVSESVEVTQTALGATDGDLVYFFLGTIAGAGGAIPGLYTALKIYRLNLWSTGAGSGANIIAQARTRNTLWASDRWAEWDWNGSTTTGINSSSAQAHTSARTFETWISTGIATSTAEPSFPDDVVAGITPAAERVQRRSEVGPTLAAGAVSVSVGFERVARRAEVGPSIASAGAIAAGFERVARRSEVGPTISSVSIGTPLSSAVIMFTGHSLLDQPIPDYVQVLAGSAGVSIDWNRQHNNGSTINNRGWNGGSNTGFLTGQNRDDTSGLNLISHFRNVTAVSGKTTADPYTALVITQRHDTLNSLEWEATAQTLRQFYELVLQGSPGCLGYFYSSWFDYDVADLADWIAYARETTTADAAIAGRINASLADESRSYRIRIIPASAALAELVEQATVGSVAGITQGTTQATLDVLFSDTVHPTSVGKYFLACVVYGAVYRRDPRGLGYPVTVTATQAASLQQIAWEVLLDTYGTAPHTGPDLSATAAKQAIVDYVPAYADFFPGTPIDVPAYQAYWGGTSSVMHFDPPTTEGIWLGLPLGAPAMGFERVARRSEVGPTITAATAGILAGAERVARRAEVGPTLTPGPVTISAGFERVARPSEVGPSVSSGSTTILPAAERIQRRAEVGPVLTPGAVSLTAGAERVARRSELGPTLTPGTVAILAAVERVARRAEAGPTLTATSPGVAAGFERCLRASETGPTLTAGAVVLALAFERLRSRSESGPTIDEQALPPRDVIAPLSWTHTPGAALAATWSPTQ